MNPTLARLAVASALVAAAVAAMSVSTRADEPRPVAPKAPPDAPAPAGPVPGAPAATPARPVAATDEIDRVAVEAHVKALASSDFGGRGSADDREKAWTYVAAQLKAAGAGLVPGATSMLVPFAAVAKTGTPSGNNVAAWIPGTDADAYVILSAHFDHLAPRDDPAAPGTKMWFPGADDNASGTAALIEITRALAKGKRPLRSVLVLGFDLEETGCGGSRAYVEKPLLPLERCAAFTTMDMLGRSIGDLYPGLLLVMGAERSDALLAATAVMPAAPGIVVRELGMDFNQLGWSDYVPFEEKKVPCLFFTSGACRDYHRPTDTADRIDAAALHGRAATVLAAVRGLAGATARPVWKESAVPRLSEIESIHALVREAGAKEDEMQVPAPMRTLRRNFETNLEKTLARGAVTVGERAAIRFQTLMLFQAASKAR